MNKSLVKIIVILLLAGTGYLVYANYLTACSSPIAYDIGNIDPRFEISEQEFVKLAQETESVWETPFQAEFFTYDPDAKFKINLVFDDRQQRTIDERDSRSVISSREQAYSAKVRSYDATLAQHQTDNQKYDADVAAYDKRLKAYNDQVDYWNKNGGAPAKEFNQLQQEKRALQAEAKRLETIRKELNSTVAELNTIAAEINKTAHDLNLDVDAYNGKFGTSREFDQGNYTGNEINIYQFNTEDDLHLVLAHEFGHALGIEHVDEPEAIMYYLMEKQNLKVLHLAEADMSALRSTCHIR